MRWRWFVGLMGLSLVHVSSAIHAAEGSSPSVQIEEVARAVSGQSPRTQVSAIVEAYRVRFPGNIQSEDLQQLRERFDAAVTAAFYSKDIAVARESLQLYRLLESRQAVEPRDAESVRSTLVKSRDLSSAAELAYSSGDDRFGRVLFDNRVRKQFPSVMRPVEGGLEIRDVHDDVFQHGIVVVSSPLCHFSAAVGRAIASDRRLGLDFENSLWLVPPEGNLHLREIQQWNESHPGMDMALTYQWTDWSRIDGWQTPTFFFFHDGRVVERIVGWPLDGSRKGELLAAAERWRSLHKNVSKSGSK